MGEAFLDYVRLNDGNEKVGLKTKLTPIINQAIYQNICTSTLNYSNFLKFKKTTTISKFNKY